MIIEAIIPDQINIQNFISAVLDESVIKAQIDAKYTNRCYKNMYVLHVIEIIKRSGINFIPEDPDGRGYICVYVRVKALIYSIGDPIAGCLVAGIAEHEKIFCTTSNADVYVVPDPIIASIKQGDIIPLRISSIRYAPYASRITIGGVPYLPVKQAQVYKVFGNLDRSKITIDTQPITMLADLTNKMPQCASAIKRAIRAYEDTIPGNFHLIEGSQTSNELEGKFISRHAKLDQEAPYVLVSDKLEDMGASEFVELHATAVIGTLLREYIEHCAFVCGMIETYGTQEKFAAAKNLWAILNKHRKSPS